MLAYYIVGTYSILNIDNLDTNDGDSDLDEKVKSLREYLEENGEDTTSTNASSSPNGAVTIPHLVMSADQPSSQRPLTGPYHRRLGRPVLPAGWF